MDDASPVHGGTKQDADGNIEGLCYGKSGEEFLKEDRDSFAVRAPPCFTSKRPNDQRQCNALFRYKYDAAIATLGNSWDVPLGL